jgi:hypothetical protein
MGYYERYAMPYYEVNALRARLLGGGGSPAEDAAARTAQAKAFAHL